jgi:hypothetical protein
MNTDTIFLFFLIALFIPVTASASICQQGSTFPEWMIGYFHAEFADGSSANAKFSLWYANVTFSTGENGTLTMTEPLHQGDGFYIFHECVQIQGMEPEQRCSLLVRRGGGYIEHIHKQPELIPICPESLSSPGLEVEIVTRIG